MELLERADVSRPVLATEPAPMESLRVMVLVRARMLAETLEVLALHAHALQPREGESAERAQVRAGAEIVAQTLAHQVVLADGKPMWTAEEWLVHGGKYPGEVMRLHAIAQRLAGVDESGVTSGDVAKN